MSERSNDINQLWQDAKKAAQKSTLSTADLILQANKKKKLSQNFHVVNILILSIVLVGICAFFYYVANFQQTISHIGVGLMTGGLAVRIFIEFISMIIFKRIDLTDTASETNQKTMRFYAFRRRIHGPVTIIIVLAYTIGFFLLTPEFSLYFSTPMMVLIDGSYIIGAVILTWQIRKGIVNEIKTLNELVSLRNNLTDS